MERIWALYKKELRTYFNSPIAYIVLMVLLIGVGFLFFQTFFAAGQATLRGFFRLAAGSFVLFGPAITMKLLADEKKTGTIERLLTLPLHEWEMVVGKFLAAWTLLAVYLAITLVYPISIAFLGDLDSGPVLGGYIGLFFLGGIFVALGVFASSISRSQVISLIVAFTIATLLYMLDLLLPFLPSGAQNVLAFVAVDTHFKNIGRGVLDSRDMIYSFSLIATFLFLAAQVMQARLADHTKKWRLNRVLYIGAALGCLIALNAFSYLLHGRVDLTEDHQFTLSDATVDLVSELDDQLTITAYFSKEIPAPANTIPATVRDLLEEYRAAGNGRVAYRILDPDTPGANGKPDQDAIVEAKQLGVPKTEVRAYAKDQVQMVRVYMGIALQYGEASEAIPVVRNPASLEYDLTTRIAKLVRDKTPTLGLLIGHGEFSLQQGFGRIASFLGDKFEVREIDLAKSAAALDEVDVLLVAGPKKPLPERDLFAIDQHLMRGGKAAFFFSRQDVDARTMIGRPIETGLAKLTAAYGVDMFPALLLDQKSETVGVERAEGGIRMRSFVQYPPFVRVTDLAKNTPLTKNLKGIVLPFSSPLELRDVQGVEAQAIARSSEKTWLFESDDSFVADPGVMMPPTEDGDFAGPRDLVATLQGNLPSYFKGRSLPLSIADNLIPVSPETRVVVVGSGQWISDALPSRLNLAFFANLLDWLVQDEALVSIRTRSINNRPLKAIGDSGRVLFKYGNMLLPPLLLLGFGIVRLQMRKRRKRKALAALAATARGEE